MIAIVTGAANGIGLAIGEAFVKEGAVFIAGDIDEKKCKAESERLGRDGATVRHLENPSRG